MTNYLCRHLGMAGLFAVAAPFLAMALGCTSPAGNGVESKPRVITTTTMLADAVRQLAGDEVEVASLVDIGADPHVFQPTPATARAVSRSNLVVTSGLGLEGWLDDLVAHAGGERPLLVASRGIEPIRMEGFAEGIDPHFWFDPKLWSVAVTQIASELDRLLSDRPKAQRSLAVALKHILLDLEDLERWARAQFNTLPKARRVLVTSHDAFNYLGRAFGLDVRGIQGLSTEEEASQRDLANIIDLVKDRSLPAVFVETSVNPALIRRVASETGTKALGPLFSDSLGDPSGPAATYAGMFESNVRMIVEGLGGAYVARSRFAQASKDSPRTEVSQ